MGPRRRWVAARGLEFIVRVGIEVFRLGEGRQSRPLDVRLRRHLCNRRFPLIPSTGSGQALTFSHKGRRHQRVSTLRSRWQLCEGLPLWVWRMTGHAVDEFVFRGAKMGCGSRVGVCTLRIDWGVLTWRGGAPLHSWIPAFAGKTIMQRSPFAGMTADWGCCC